MSADIFGNIVDADTIEQYALETLQAWLPSHLAHQEARRGLDPGYLLPPRSWPVISELNLRNNDQLPAVVLVSPGTLGTPVSDRGVYRADWVIELVIVTAARTEREARKLAALYLAAARGALLQNRTLGGHVENTRWIDRDNHAAGNVRSGDHRAIYASTFAITVRDAIDARLGPEEPPPDPHDPPAIPLRQQTAQIDVTAANPGEDP